MLNLEGVHNKTVTVPKLITVRLNDHNINAGHKAILESYQKYNQDPSNPYSALESIKHWELIYDATSHWVKEINTVFNRAADDKGNIYKVPLEMEQVPGSLTGEVLCDKIFKQISCVKKVKDKTVYILYTNILYTFCIHQF